MTRVEGRRLDGIALAKAVRQDALDALKEDCMSTSTADAKSRLLKRRAELFRSYTRHNDQERVLDAVDEPDWPDHAALHVDDEVLHRLSDRERIELAEIQAALDRIAQDHYGVCEICGVDIAPARLAVLPHARRCVDCQA